MKLALLRPALILFALTTCVQAQSEDARAQLERLERELGGALAGWEGFLRLPDLAYLAADSGDWPKAEAYAQALLDRAPEYKRFTGAYGSAIFYGHIVLGRVFLSKGDLDRAGQELLLAATTPGSPDLNTFGPNMSLAKALIEKGRAKVVIQYLNACRSFWKLEKGRLSQWIEAIKRGEMPRFGSNLVYSPVRR